MVRHAHYSLLYQGCLAQLLGSLEIREGDKLVLGEVLNRVDSAAAALAFLETVRSYVVTNCNS